MGRELKCEMCEGSGYGPEAKRLADQWYGEAKFEPAMTGSELLNSETPEVHDFVLRNVVSDAAFYTRDGQVNLEHAVRLEATRLSRLFNQAWCHHLDRDDVQALLEANRLVAFTHTWTKADGWQRRSDGYIPTVREVNLWSLTGLGHDGVNQSICVKAKAERLGYELHCAFCEGEGVRWRSAEDQAAYEAWQEYDPPKGEGFQLWSTTTAGHPLGPVFETLEALCAWAAEHATTFGYKKATAAEWLAMLKDDFVHHQVGNITFR